MATVLEINTTANPAFVTIPTGAGLPPFIGVNGAVLVESPVGTISWMTPAAYAAIIAPFVLSDSFNCAAGLLVNTLVYIDAPDHVAAANAVAVGTMPAIGFVISKPTPTTALVSGEGLLAVFTGLTPGTQYFAAVGGGVAKAGNPGFPTLTGQVVQKIGIAADATTLHVEVDEDVTIL